MLNPDGSINTNGYDWSEHGGQGYSAGLATLPTLGVGGGAGAGYNPSYDPLFNQAMNALGAGAWNIRDRTFPRGYSGLRSSFGAGAAVNVSPFQDTTRDPNYSNSQFSIPTPNPFGAGIAANYGVPPVGASPNPNAPGVAAPFTSYQGQPDQYYGPPLKFGTPSTPIGGSTGGTSPSGMHPDEMKWAALAAKMGLDWTVTKNVYLNPARNGTYGTTGSLNGDIAQAIQRQTDDKAWGDAARAAGILTGDPAADNQVWIDHYNARGNMQYDPMAGHNDAIAQYQANQQALDQQSQNLGGDPYANSWYKP